MMLKSIPFTLFILVVMTAARQHAIASESPLFGMLAISVPKNVRGYSVDTADTNRVEVFVLDGWLNNKKKLTIDGANFRIQSPSNLVEALSLLVAAYKSGEVERVVTLYDEVGKEAVTKMVERDDIRQKWKQFIGSVEKIVPILAWREKDSIHCKSIIYYHDQKAKELRQMPYPLVLDHHFRFMTAKLDSPLHSGITLFLSDGERMPEELLVNYSYIVDRYCGSK